MVGARACSVAKACGSAVRRASQIKGGFRVAPIFFFRSALPVNLIDGRDLNLDGDAFDIPAKAYRVAFNNIKL